MIKIITCTMLLFIGQSVIQSTASAQTNSASEIEGAKEAVYTTLIEDRTDAIIKALSLTNAKTSSMVHDILVEQYRVMRARDILINAQLTALGKEVNYENRADALQTQTKALHARFVSRLSELLTPEQVETVKDKMTYNKVKVTSDAYAEIVPGLTEADKAKIQELLKAAREEAVDGGSSFEKSAIFQKYKDQINSYLNASGHDVAKAYQEWQQRQPVNKDANGNTNAPLNPLQK